MTPLLTVTHYLISFAVVLQCIELLLIRREVAAIWRWHPLTLTTILFAQLAFVVTALFVPVFYLFAFLSSLVLAVRFRGSYNGGSDSMTLLILAAVSVAALFPPFAKASLLYIGLQALLSYFIAGVVKIKNPEWRNGSALKTILTDSPYSIPESLRRLARSPRFIMPASWAVMLFECGAPLGFANQWLTIAFICTALCFHLGNVYALGLNRFFWAWLAAFPGLYSLFTVFSSRH